LVPVRFWCFPSHERDVGLLYKFNLAEVIVAPKGILEKSKSMKHLLFVGVPE
jgi:hypothetical protein